MYSSERNFNEKQGFLPVPVIARSPSKRSEDGRRGNPL